MSILDAATLARFVELAGERLEGEWTVIGGCVLPLLGVEHRTTVDIDVAGPDEADMEQMLALMEIAEEIGLPVETINQAGSHFLRLVDGWAAHRVLLHEGPSAKLFVPDATLFLLLKLRRLSEADLVDCREMLALARRRSEPVEVPRVRGACETALATTDSSQRRERIQALLGALEREA